MEHEIESQRIQHSWDGSLEPSLGVGSGDVVGFDLLMAGHGQVQEGDTFADAKFDFDTLYNLLGPVYVEGARPRRHAEGRDPGADPWGLGMVRDHDRSRHARLTSSPTTTCGRSTCEEAGSSSSRRT